MTARDVIQNTWRRGRVRVDGEYRHAVHPPNGDSASHRDIRCLEWPVLGWLLCAVGRRTVAVLQP